MISASRSSRRRHRSPLTPPQHLRTLALVGSLTTPHHSIHYSTWGLLSCLSAPSSRVPRRPTGSGACGSRCQWRGGYGGGSGKGDAPLPSLYNQWIGHISLWPDSAMVVLHYAYNNCNRQPSSLCPCSTTLGVLDHLVWLLQHHTSLHLFHTIPT